jgi:hypothetical protein
VDPDETFRIGASARPADVRHEQGPGMLYRSDRAPATPKTLKPRRTYDGGALVSLGALTAHCVLKVSWIFERAHCIVHVTPALA